MNSIVQLKILEENNTKLIIETIYKLKEKICDIDFVKNNILLMDQKTNYIANSTPSSIRKGIATFRDVFIQIFNDEYNQIGFAVISTDIKNELLTLQVLVIDKLYKTALSNSINTLLKLINGIIIISSNKLRVNLENSFNGYPIDSLLGDLGFIRESSMYLDETMKRKQIDYVLNLQGEIV